jgi:hypothetical protein
MPVTRPPPCSPGRTVRPYPVPRLYSHPRCKALSSREPPPLFALRKARPGYPSPVPALGALLPGKTLPLPPAPIAPFQHIAHSAFEKAGQGTGVAVQTVVVGVASQPAVQLPVERASWQVPVLFDPCRAPTARRLELLARGTPLDPWHALAIWHPVQRESQTREASPHAWMKATEAPEVGFVGGDLEGALRSPLWEHPIEPFCVVLVAAGADPVVGVAAQQCCTPTVGLDDFIQPQVQGIGQIHVCQDG